MSYRIVGKIKETAWVTEALGDLIILSKAAGTYTHSMQSTKFF